MSFELNIDLNDHPIPSQPSIRSSKRTPSPVKTPDKRLSTNTSGSFVDFGKIPEETRPQSPRKKGTMLDPEEAAKPGVPYKGSRFAAFATAEVTFVKGVNDAILSVLSDEQASSRDFGPHFLQMDLSRLISKALGLLSLQPVKDSEIERGQKQWAPESLYPEELKATVTMQTVLMTELGKSMEKVLKHNSDLADVNRRLILERNAAVQARTDMMAMLNEEKQLNEERVKNHAVELKRNEYLGKVTSGRQFFDEGKLIDLAMQEFRRQRTPPTVEKVTEEILDDTLPPLTLTTPREAIQFAADMEAVKSKFEPDSTLTVAHVRELSRPLVPGWVITLTLANHSSETCNMRFRDVS